jgi:carboxyl-terminal processing protease
MTDPNVMPGTNPEPFAAAPQLPPDPPSGPPSAPSFGPPSVPQPGPQPGPAPWSAAPRARGGGTRWIAAALAPILAVVLFAGGAAAERAGVLGAPTTPVATPAPSGGDPELALIEEAWRAIHDNYVDSRNLDDQELAYGAIRGMTEAVGDEGHTTFLTAEEAKAVDQSLSGTFVGIGVQVSDDTSEIVIGSVFPGTPAEEADLRRGDRIVAVDGRTTEGETIDEVVSWVRGPEGERVTLTIAREGRARFDVTIVRRKFDLPLISWSMVPGRAVALIRLDQFATGATTAMRDAITRARADGATAIVLDLRANPGGYVNEAVGITSQFIAEGAVYRSIDAGGGEKDVPVEAGGLATDLPIVVLADGDTASSAEIVTGAIQDAKRGRVVGVKTFGTGTVLGRFDLADGSSLRIGVERWLTRGGRPIWHEGLQPDVVVTLPDDAQPLRPDDLRDLTAAQLATSTDAQLLKALELLAGDG